MTLFTLDILRLPFVEGLRARASPRTPHGCAAFQVPAEVSIGLDASVLRNYFPGPQKSLIVAFLGGSDMVVPHGLRPHQAVGARARTPAHRS